MTRLMRRWRLYKRFLLIFAVINAFSLSAALVIGVRYFSFERIMMQKQRSAITRVSQADQALTLLRHFKSDFKTKRLTLASIATEADLITLLHTLNVATPMTRTDLTSVQNRLLQIKIDSYRALKENLIRRASIEKELMAIGLLTLLFGIVLPLTIMAFIVRALNSLRREMQRSLIDFLRGWRRSEHEFGGNAAAFKNPEFWLQILLLGGQFFSQMSNHPAAQIAGELALTIRQELQKADSNAA